MPPLRQPPAPLDLPLGVLGAPVAILWIVAVLNFYNFDARHRQDQPERRRCRTSSTE